MGKKLTYERYHWFHGQIKAVRYPNARQLAEKFEISQKQAQRDIEFMKDRLDAPLFYDSAEKGYEYEYEDDSYELPPVWFKEDELLSLCLALRLASTLPDHVFKDSLYTLLAKFLAFRLLGSSPGLHPLHLLCYMGSWHLIAFCTLKNGLRDFALSRVREITFALQPVKVPKDLPPIKDYIRETFGVMTGKESVEVCLKFVPEVADWISEQIWHSGQEVTRNGDGSICMRFPVADFREVRKEILRYGSSVEVLLPQELREDVKREILKMSKAYE